MAGIMTMSKKPVSDPDGKVCIAQIGAAHGIKGDVRIKLFSDDPAAFTQYGPLSSADGSETFEIMSARASKTVFICRIKGLTNRNRAEELNGTFLYADRSLLPELDEEEFYHSDLIGLSAQLEDGTELGKIIAVHDFGSGDLLDVAPARGKGFFIPFTREVVPTINLDGGFVIVVPPEGLLDETDRMERALEGEAANLSDRPELLEGLPSGSDTA